MRDSDINPLIREKLIEDVDDDNILGFIEDVLRIEQSGEGNYGKIKKCERALAKYVRMDG